MKLEVSEKHPSCEKKEREVRVGFAVFKRMEGEGYLKKWRDTILYLFNPNADWEDVLKEYKEANKNDKLMAKGQYKHIMGGFVQTDRGLMDVCTHDEWSVAYEPCLHYFPDSERVMTKAIKIIRKCIEESLKDK